ncbi:MAG TPA: glycosyltransferase [Woeseiaceae bacterium]|nr:glycosyltransferase [Woeseiaceae bacterium]
MPAERPEITHINLARGFRGGESQTLLLVRELAGRGWRQQFIGRGGEPLVERLAGVDGLTITPVGGVLGAAVRVAAPLVHAHEARAAQAAWVASKLRGCRYVLTRRVMKPPSRSAVTSRIYRDAAAVTALSRAIADVLADRFPGLEATVIPSALAAAEPDPRRVAEIRAALPEPFLVGNVAALDVAKGQLELLAAAKTLTAGHPDTGFVFVGDGHDGETIRAAAAGQSGVHFTGFVDNVADYLAAFDVFAFPSHHEGLGSVLLQAMAAGTPIVASDTGGIPELIRHEETGLLVAPRDAAALAAAIERLYGDEELRQRLTGAARRRLGEFSVAGVADRLETLYRGLG